MINAPSLDLLIRLKNGYVSGKKNITAPGSIFKKSILDLLQKNNFIESYTEKVENNKSNLTIKLKYESKQPSISNVKIFSKPGRRLYERADSLPWGASSNSLIIVSTSKGLISAKEAQKLNIGGEIIAEIL